MVFKTDYRLMQVTSIAECSKGSQWEHSAILLTFNNLSLRALFCLFLSDRLRQVLLVLYWLSAPGSPLNSELSQHTVSGHYRPASETSFSGHDRPTSETPFKWHFAGTPMAAHYAVQSAQRPLTLCNLLAKLSVEVGSPQLI